MIYTNENWKPPVTYCEPNKVEGQRMTREEAVEKLEAFTPMVVDDTREALDMAIEALQAKKHAHWKIDKDGWPECSECGFSYGCIECTHDKRENYCPHCGAKMDKGGDTE